MLLWPHRVSGPLVVVVHSNSVNALYLLNHPFHCTLEKVIILVNDYNFKRFLWLKLFVSNKSECFPRQRGQLFVTSVLIYNHLCWWSSHQWSLEKFLINQKKNLLKYIQIFHTQFYIFPTLILVIDTHTSPTKIACFLLLRQLFP